MKKLPGSQAASVSLLRKAAGDAWGRQDFGAYFDLMGKAELLTPDDPSLLLDLGAAYGMRTEFPKAIDLLERAVEKSRDKSRMLGLVGYVCREFQRYDLAAHYLGLAAQEPGASPETLAKLAEMKERLRETSEAEAAVERALKLDSKCQLALLVQARLNRVAGRLDEAERIVRFLLSRSDRSGESTRVRGWYELGAILDRQGRYDEAIAALMAGKTMLSPNAAATITARKNIYRELQQAAGDLSANHFKKWREIDPDPTGRRLALIGGHPRSGTTLLEQVLDAHSDIVSAEETEIFFNTYYETARDPSRPMVSMLDSLSAPAIRSARDSYFRRMDLFVSGTAQDRLLIDKNPSLTGLIPGMLCIIPQTQIIIALRDPRDVCLSCFMQHIGDRYLTLEATVDEYCSLMGFWLAIKPMLPTPALEIRYEDVVKDMQLEAEKTLRFLNLDWEPAVLNFTENARKKVIRSPTYAEVARPIHQGAIGRWRHYRKHLEPYLGKLAPLVEAFDYEAD
jgi:tetratricopeptide (TPR) repeat protein